MMCSILSAADVLFILHRSRIILPANQYPGDVSEMQGWIKTYGCL